MNVSRSAGFCFHPRATLIFAMLALFPSESLWAEGAPQDKPDVIFLVPARQGEGFPSMKYLAAEILEGTNLRIQIRVMPSARLEKIEAEADNCRLLPKPQSLDMVWIGPIGIYTMGVFARDGLDRPVNRPEDLIGYRVGSIANRPADLLLVEHGVKPEYVMQDDLNWKKLEAGHLDYWVVAVEFEQTLSSWAKKPPLRKVLSFPPIDIGIVCNGAMPKDTVAKLRGATERFYARHKYDWTQFTLPAPGRADTP